MPAPRTLDELEADVARDLALTAHPRAPWLEAKTSGGAPVLDVLVIGAGQCGLAVAHALRRDQVTNILVLDRAPEGLSTSRAPDPSTAPNNHLSYAVQWFAFAGFAVLIYLLALRHRQRGRKDEPAPPQ